MTEEGEHPVATPALEIDQPELYTIDDLDRLPGRWYNLTNGVLTVVPSPSYDHMALELELAVALRAGLPEHLRVNINVGIDFPDDTYRVPDAGDRPRRGGQARA